jgi:hypothetical protein
MIHPMLKSETFFHQKAALMNYLRRKIIDEYFYFFHFRKLETGSEFDLNDIERKILARLKILFFFEGEVAEV